MEATGIFSACFSFRIHPQLQLPDPILALLDAHCLDCQMDRRHEITKPDGSVWLDASDVGEENGGGLAVASLVRLGVRQRPAPRPRKSSADHAPRELRFFSQP